jgi:hypothetical protein
MFTGSISKYKVTYEAKLQRIVQSATKRHRPPQEATSNEFIKVFRYEEIIISLYNYRD